MGRQINFFLHQGDQESFDTLLKSFGDVVLFRHHHYTDKLTTIDDTLIRDIEKEKNRGYIIRSEYFKDIELEYVENHHYWCVKNTSLPVLLFDRSVDCGSRIQRGRLFFEPKYLSDNEWLNKPDDFVLWADKTLKCVRNRLKKHKYQMGSYNYAEYLGAIAQKWLEETDATVENAGLELVAKNP